MKKKYYITTAIDYTNGKPHIGHAYEKILADAIARYQRLRGREVFFLIGVDQYGQKIAKSAAELGKEPLAYVEEISAEFTKTWRNLQISNDAWAKTTDDLHKRVVQKILERFQAEGKLYKKSARGFYSLRQEQFITEKERDSEGNFGEEWGEVVELNETNYYFRLSDYLPWLEKFLQKNPDAVFPRSRAKDILSAISENRNDLCVTRPKKRFSWGIELSFDPDFITYVWFDALLNYISFAGFLKESGAPLPDFQTLWPADAQVIGKDILRPAHGIYWLCMLKAIGFKDEEMPRLLVHGWWNVKSENTSQKMSKSLGNVIDPNEVAKAYGVDAIRHYLLRDMSTGQDADYDLMRLEEVYTSELANGIGNLLSRSVNMCQRFLDGTLQKFTPATFAKLGEYKIIFQEFCEILENARHDYVKAMDEFQTREATLAYLKIASACDRIAEKCAPWKRIKENDEISQMVARAALYYLCEGLTHISCLASPFMPNCSTKIQKALNTPQIDRLENLRTGVIADGHQISKEKCAALFPRLK